jgi:hypothetical protein
MALLSKTMGVFSHIFLIACLVRITDYKGKKILKKSKKRGVSYE